MPRHDYTCVNCGNKEERFVPLDKLEEMQFCSCGMELRREFPIIGATHGDETSWIESTTEFIKDGEPETLRYDPVKSRTELKKLLKEKGLEPVG